MQVKRFEAKSMKDALEMVKTQLGPEAIILQARDNSKAFGLMGEKSVEVTAAISQQGLQRKQLAEKRLSDHAKQRYSGISARAQRSFIDKVFETATHESPAMQAMRNQKYIDIADDEERQPPQVQAEAAPPPEVEDASSRIRTAAKRAWSSFQDVDERAQKKASHSAKVQHPKIPQPEPEPAERENSHELLALRKEIRHLKGIIESFNKVPQSFVTLHPGAEEGIPYELSFMFDKLTKAGVQLELILEILNRAQSSLPKAQLQKKAFIDAWVAKYLLDKVEIAEARASDRYHVFVGGMGQGKTSALVKMASHLVIRERKKIAIITTDAQKLGAAEQLRIYAQILNVPFAILRKPSDWEIVSQRLSGVDHILVDFPGKNLRSMGEIDRIRELLPPRVGGRAIHFVQSVLAKDEAAFDLAKRYRELGIKDVIFTCLDESSHHGLILNFQHKFGTPLHSFGIGPQIPEDFEPATKERVVDLIFKLTKVKKGRG